MVRPTSILTALAAVGKDHVLQFHTPEAIAAYIVDAGLSQK
jgi:hypothetical protein